MLQMALRMGSSFCTCECASRLLLYMSCTSLYSGSYVYAYNLKYTYALEECMHALNCANVGCEVSADPNACFACASACFSALVVSACRQIGPTCQKTTMMTTSIK
jgi:hypothetical protein